MKLSEDEVRYVAGLANLALAAEELHKFSHDLSEILTHVESLQELNTEDVPPMAQVLSEAEETATLRADQIRPPLGSGTAAANAPLAAAGYFKVPKVIER